MNLLNWFTKKTKETKCEHEYFLMYERCQYSSFLVKYFEVKFHLSCVHCGRGICHSEKIRYHGSDSYNPLESVRNAYTKTIFTRVYAKYNIINKLTKLSFWTSFFYIMWRGVYTYFSYVDIMWIDLFFVDKLWIVFVS